MPCIVHMDASIMISLLNPLDGVVQIDDLVPIYLRDAYSPLPVSLTLQDPVIFSFTFLTLQLQWFFSPCLMTNI